MSHNTDDLRIREMKELAPPSHTMREHPCTPEVSSVVYESRQAIHRILHGMDDRLVVVIGPCSIHDTAAAVDYAKRLKAERLRFKGELEVVMRVYFEKPRTTVGELASGLSCPVGFKNGTDGNVKIAVDAMKSASAPHHFLSVTKGGHSAIVSTTGNEDCHVILRGGKAPNYDTASVQAACAEMAKAGLAQRIMVDASHANSNKKPENQPAVCDEVAVQIAQGDARIFGLMVESNLVAGRQDIVEGQTLVYGQSVTDGCIDWQSSVGVLERLAESVRARRRTVLMTGQ